MTRDEIAKEFDLFFEFDTEDRSTVTSVSARLFAERISDLTVAAERQKIAQSWDALHEKYMADPLRRQMMLSYEMVAKMIRGNAK